ncbi:hypothetical protein Tco_1346316 [Tanacetum coccineum]
MILSITHLIAGAENRTPMLEISILRKYSELTEAQQLQDDCDFQATNIILHCLPPDVYALVNHQEAAKDIWDRVKLLMKGTELSYQERECRLYNLYPDPLALVANSPTLYNPSQSPQHSVSPQPFISPLVTQHSQADFPQLDSGLAVPTFQQGEDPIECINKNQATIHDCQSHSSQSSRKTNIRVLLHMEMRIAITLKGNYAAVSFPDVLSEVQYSDSYPNDMINQDVQEMQYSEQTHIDYFQENKIHSDSNIIPYSQYLQESQDAVIHDTNSSAPNDLLVLSLVEQMTNQVANLDKENQTNKMVNESLSAKLERYKERVAIFKQRQNVDLKKREKLIDSQTRLTNFGFEYAKLAAF